MSQFIHPLGIDKYLKCHVRDFREQLSRRLVAKQFRESTVHTQRTTISGYLKNPNDGLLEDRSVLLFRLSKRLHRMLLFRDISRHFGRTNNAGRTVFNGRNCYGDI